MSFTSAKSLLSKSTSLNCTKKVEMSSLKSGPDKSANRTVNSVGSTHFRKWFLYRTTLQEDMWHKPEVNDEQGIIVADSYIQIRRINVCPDDREYGYRIWFQGGARF